MDARVSLPVSRRIFLRACATMSVLPFSLVSSEVSAQAQVVDRAGSLRMLSQRMQKAYCQLGLSILPNDAETVLARSLTRFNGAVVALRENKASDQSIIKRIETDWTQFRDLVSTAPTKANFLLVDSLSESMLQSAEALTTQLAASLGVQSARLTNVSGRQRMLSQRMAKSAFAIMWGMNASLHGKRFDVAREQFASAIVELRNSPIKNQDISRALDSAETQFGFFDSALGNRNELAKLSSARAANIAKSNERLLEVFDELTGLFAQQSA